MARQARVVVPEAAHHVVARGVNGCRLYRHGYDKRRYLKRFAALAEECGIVVHGYCLMDNHVHFLLVPKSPQSLAKFFQRLHTWWAGYFNRLMKRSGHLFESRYYSSRVDEAHYWAAMRYIELNPQRAGLIQKASTVQLSSLWAHLNNAPDPLVPLQMDAIRHRRWSGTQWREFLEEADWQRDKRLRRHFTAS
jgi:REP-associated tyrosine transposase